MPVQPPSGTVTFLFTDIDDATRFWESMPAEMAEAVRAHDVIVRSAIQRHGGLVCRPVHSDPRRHRWRPPWSARRGSSRVAAESWAATAPSRSPSIPAKSSLALRNSSAFGLARLLDLFGFHIS